MNPGHTISTLVAQVEGLHHGIVSINGAWPDQPEHVYTFRNPSLTEEGNLVGQARLMRRRNNFPIHFSCFISED